MRVTELQNVVLGVTRLVDAPPGKAFRLTIQDRDSKEVIWMDISQEVADQIVEKLTRGIQVVKAMPA